MKVLVISDNNENIDFIESFLAPRGYDVIVYKWLIKAIDNIEEIKPDMIIVSAAEYPRHWKTLASFVQSGIGGDNIKLYLYEPTALSEEEENKAKALGIEGCFSSLDNESFEQCFAEIGSTANRILNSQIIINSPVDGSLLSGKVISKTDSSYTFKTNIKDLEKGQTVEQCSVAENGNVVFFSAQITSVNKDKGILSLSVIEYYEEV